VTSADEAFDTIRRIANEQAKEDPETSKVVLMALDILQVVTQDLHSIASSMKSIEKAARK
jgi:hypothetical protein